MKAWFVELAAASVYSVELMLPSPPLAARYWLSKVTMPAKTGVDTEVPPKMEHGSVPAKQALSMSVIPVVGESQVLLDPEPPSIAELVQTR